MKARVIVISVLFASQGLFAKVICQADMDKFCKGILLGDGKMSKCMNKNSDKLSKACLKQRTDFAQARKDNDKYCEPLFEKYCKDVKPGDGRIIQCMKENEKNFSTECKDARSRMFRLRANEPVIKPN
jgi:hypothetical protein